MGVCDRTKGKDGSTHGMRACSRPQVLASIRRASNSTRDTSEVAPPSNSSSLVEPRSRMCVRRYGQCGLTDRDIVVEVWVQIRKRDRVELEGHLLCPDIGAGPARTTRRGILTWLWICRESDSEQHMLLIHPEGQSQLGYHTPLKLSERNSLKQSKNLDRKPRRPLLQDQGGQNSS